MNNLDVLEQLINYLHDLYVSFNNEFYKNKEYEQFNFKRFTVSQAKNNLYFNNVLLKDYIKELHNFYNEYVDFTAYYAKGCEIRSRIKFMPTIQKKLLQFSNRSETEGSFVIKKSLNDLFGIRVILDNINQSYDILEHQLDRYKSQNLISRYYYRNEGDYKGTHCYFQDSNRHFPWELQIWDHKDKIDNVNSHVEHERKRKQEIEVRH